MTTPSRPRTTLEAQALQLGVALALVAFVVWSWLALPASWLLDSGEFVATTWSMGVSHPPGHPTYLLTTRLFTVPALGGLPWRVHLASAAAAAIAIGTIPWVAVRLDIVRDRVGLAASGVAAVVAATSYAFTFQAIRAEVYALNVAAIALAIACIATPADREPDLRRVAVGAVLLGVGLGNHHYLTIFAAPAVLVAVLQVGTTLAVRLRAVTVGVVAGALTQLSWLGLVATSAARPWPSWPWATDGGSLWWLVSAQAFQKSAGNVVRVDPIAGTQNVITMLLDLLTPVGFVALALGLAFGALRARRAAAVLVPLILFNLITQSLFDFDPLNPDVSGYFMVAVWGAAVLLVVPLSLLGTPRARGIATATFAVGALACRAAIPPLSPATVANPYEADAWRDARLVDVGPDGVWISDHFETGFDLWVGFAIEDRRPDVVHVHRPWRTWPGFDAMLVDRVPAAGPLLDDQPDIGGLDLEALQAFADDGRDVRIEPGLLLTPEEALASDPVGLTRRIRATGDAPSAAGVADARRRFDAVLARVDRMSREARQTMLWASVQTARAQSMAGDPAGALVLLEPALAISPDDPSLQAMARDLAAAAAAR